VAHDAGPSKHVVPHTLAHRICGSRRPHPLAHAQCHGATPLPPWRSQQRTRLRGRCQWVDVSKWTVPRFMAVHSSQWHGAKLVPFHFQRLCPLEDVAPHVQSYWP
jgi:hypothetical protein